MIAVAVFVGGALGALLRHLVFAAQPSARAAFLVNVAGSFTLGVLLATGPGELWLAALGTGVLGGLTTFSTVSVIAVQLALSPASPERRAGVADAPACPAENTPAPVSALVADAASRRPNHAAPTSPALQAAGIANYARAAAFALAMLAACALAAWAGGALLG
ncbi:fluoride efflux transporter FluC [Buchananella felis]|uniref:fluoride efflux transporter FluC n=1 Tax=Buchananella felis TaxID=3231492 RepID=UPI0035279DFD